MTDKAPPQAAPRRDPYRGIVGILLAGAVGGTGASLYGGVTLGNGMLIAAAVSLGLGAGILFGVATAQYERAHPEPPPPPRKVAPEFAAQSPPAPPAAVGAVGVGDRIRDRLDRIENWIRDLGTLGDIRLAVGAAGLLALLRAALYSGGGRQLTPSMAGMAAGGCMVATVFAAAAARYLVSAVDPAILLEASGLAKGARIIAWITALAAVSIGVQWLHKMEVVRAMALVVLAVDAAVCVALLVSGRAGHSADRFQTDLGPVSMLGSRMNPIGSVLDAAERQLGIDVRSTWAFTVIRHGVEPLVVALCLVAWLSTSLAVVAVGEKGIVERFGVPVKGNLLLPGLHLHWPWPIDRVFRIPVGLVQTIEVGHEGEEGSGPENVLWAVEHAPNEYTLVLGNGRDLITIDAAVQFRISDARAWHYRTQNPADALRALAYRAVMRNTVDRTLADALSENVSVLADTVRHMIQADADAMGLGVSIVGFTIGGMHPPVPVAPAYEAVVSAEIRQVTAVVNAQADRNRIVPAAEASAASETSRAQADGFEALGKAAGEAWSFRTLEAQYRAAPQEYVFRRRLETLEQGLPGHPYTILDFRFQRDGGEVWMVP